MTFSQWFEENLADSKEDIRNHGCEGGFPHITYTSDCVKIYDQFEDEIYKALNEDAESFEYDSVDAYVATFKRKDMLQAPDTRKNLLVWYMVEREANI